MTAIARLPIGMDAGKIVAPKGTKGMAKAVSNSAKIRESVPNLDYKPDTWFYICCFPGFFEEILCDLTQIELIS